MQTNGHKLRGIEGTDTGWVRCTECGRTAGGSSEDYWTKISCNKNQGSADDYWSRKRYTGLDKRRSEREKRPEKLLAIKDRETGEPRRLTELEENRIADSISEARSRRLRKLKIEESKARAKEIKELRRKEAENEENTALPEAGTQESPHTEDREEENQGSKDRRDLPKKKRRNTQKERTEAKMYGRTAATRTLRHAAAKLVMHKQWKRKGAGRRGPDPA